MFLLERKNAGGSCVVADERDPQNGSSEPEDMF